MGSEKRNAFGNEIRASGPGPGMYEQYKGLSFVKGKFSPNITMAAKLRKSLVDQLPGPGAYNNHEENINSRSKSYSIGLKLGQSFIVKKNVPGPGAYEIDKSDAVKSPGGVGHSSNA